MFENRFGIKQAALSAAIGSALVSGLYTTDIGRKTKDYAEGKAIGAYELFLGDPKFSNYKGKWESYTVQSEDGISPIWKAARSCTKKLGANSEHWRNQIMDYNKNQGIDLAKPIHVGNRFYVPADCKCKSYGKK